MAFKKIFQNIAVILALLLLNFLMTNINARAAGFYIQEQSVSGLGSSFSGVCAMPRDASTIYYNPAGMTYLGGSHMNIGGNLIYGKTHMSNAGSTLFGFPLADNKGGNPIGAKAVPNFYYSQQISNYLWLGLGISFPFGLGSKYNSNWFGRFDSIKSKLQTADIQPTIAIRLNDWLSIGAGMNYQNANVKLTSAISDGVEGLSTLEGDDPYSFGYTAGFLLTPRQGTRVGINYKSTISHNINGRAKVTGTALSDFDVGVKAELILPDIVSLGFAHDIKKWTLLGQANWFGWNSFQDITPTTSSGTILNRVTQNYKTTWSLSTGIEYKANNKWTFRTGYQFDETPSRDEYRTSSTPDGDRDWYSVGTTFNIHDNLSFDLSATYIDVKKEKINVSRNSGFADVKMGVDASVTILALGVNYKF